MPSALSTTFTLHVTLGYGSDKSVQETLNKACKVPPPPAATTASLVSSYFSSSFFGSSSSSSSAAAAAAATAATTATARASLPPPTNGKFFVSSACQIDLTVDPTQQSTALLAVLIPPLVIDRYLETYTSTTNIQASGSCFWITDTNATELAQDLLPNIHPTLVHSTQILGIVRTSIATEENAPAEFLILQLVNRQTANATTTTAASATVVLPPMTISDILNSTNGQALAVDSAAILKVLPLSRVHFELSTTSAVAKAPTRIKTQQPPMYLLPPPHGSSRHQQRHCPNHHNNNNIHNNNNNHIPHRHLPICLEEKLHLYCHRRYHHHLYPHVQCVYIVLILYD